MLLNYYCVLNFYFFKLLRFSFLSHSNKKLTFDLSSFFKCFTKNKIRFQNKVKDDKISNLSELTKLQQMKHEEEKNQLAQQNVELVRNYIPICYETRSL